MATRTQEHTTEFHIEAMDQENPVVGGVCRLFELEKAWALNPYVHGAAVGVFGVMTVSRFDERRTASEELQHYEQRAVKGWKDEYRVPRFQRTSVDQPNTLPTLRLRRRR